MDGEMSGTVEQDKVRGRVAAISNHFLVVISYRPGVLGCAVYGDEKAYLPCHLTPSSIIRY